MIPGVLYAACLMYIKLNSKSCEALDYHNDKFFKRHGEALGFMIASEICHIYDMTICPCCDGHRYELL